MPAGKITLTASTDMSNSRLRGEIDAKATPGSTVAFQTLFKVLRSVDSALLALLIVRSLTQRVRRDAEFKEFVQLNRCLARETQSCNHPIYRLKQVDLPK